ncbi:response regulator [Woodsholea maritima]|uniref:response regulator n=1 Tax=Woodsholea maritima TaxID=240237 RepID=UPI0003610435|nr:response regulator [Woodsholea maritima]
MSELKRLAYVEDDPDIRAIAELALVDIGGFDLSLFSCGQAAVEGMEGAGPDLILMDVMMPGMDGFETVRRLRKIESLSATPIVFMTAKAQVQDIQQYKDLSLSGVITKPFDPMSLGQDVRDIWRAIQSGQAHEPSVLTAWQRQ